MRLLCSCFALWSLTAGLPATPPSVGTIPCLPAPGMCTLQVANLIAAFGDDNVAICGKLGPTYYQELPVYAPVACACPLTSDQWAHDVVAQAKVYRARSTSRKTADVIVFVHGYVETPRRMSARMRMLRDDLHALGYEGAVTALHWPSSRKGLPFNYSHDLDIANKTGYRLVTDVLDPLRSAAPPGVDLRLHVLCHSMGASFVRAAFQDLPACPSGPRLENLVFFGGDVARCSFGREPDPSLAGAAVQSRHVTTYGCAQDRLLKLSSAVRLGQEPRLGQGGLEPSLAAACATAVDGTARYASIDPLALAERWNCLVAADDVRTRGRERYPVHPFPFNLAVKLIGGVDAPEVFFPSHEWYFQDPVVLYDLRLLLQDDHERGLPPTRCFDENGCVMLKPD